MLTLPTFFSPCWTSKKTVLVQVRSGVDACAGVVATARMTIIADMKKVRRYFVDFISGEEDLGNG